MTSGGAVRELLAHGRGKVLVFCWLGWVFDFYDLILFAFLKRQIAADLGLTLPALKSRILRGRERVRARFDACCTLERDGRGNVLGARRRSGGECDGAC